MPLRNVLKYNHWSWWQKQIKRKTVDDEQYFILYKGAAILNWIPNFGPYVIHFHFCWIPKVDLLLREGLSQVPRFMVKFATVLDQSTKWGPPGSFNLDKPRRASCLRFFLLWKAESVSNVKTQRGKKARVHAFYLAVLLQAQSAQEEQLCKPLLMMQCPPVVWLSPAGRADSQTISYVGGWLSGSRMSPDCVALEPKSSTLASQSISLCNIAVLQHLGGCMGSCFPLLQQFMCFYPGYL